MISFGGSPAHIDIHIISKKTQFLLGTARGVFRGGQSSCPPPKKAFWPLTPQHNF